MIEMGARQKDLWMGLVETFQVPEIGLELWRVNRYDPQNTPPFHPEYHFIGREGGGNRKGVWWGGREAGGRVALEIEKCTIGSFPSPIFIFTSEIYFIT
jgi:hypothetical protein